MPSAVCELLPTLERRSGLSGSSLYALSLADPFAPPPLHSDSDEDLPGTVLMDTADMEEGDATRAPGSKRTHEESSPSATSAAKRARRRNNGEKISLSRNSGKDQKQSSNVPALLQPHSKTTVCVC